MFILTKWYVKYTLQSSNLLKLIPLLPKPRLSISIDTVSNIIYDKRDDLIFEIVNFPFLDGDVLRSTSYGVYISQFIRFARASSNFTDFNSRNKLLTQKLLKQCYQYYTLGKTFSKFYHRYYYLIPKFHVFALSHFYILIYNMFWEIIHG